MIDEMSQANAGRDNSFEQYLNYAADTQHCPDAAKLDKAKIVKAH